MAISYLKRMSSSPYKLLLEPALAVAWFLDARVGCPECVVVVNNEGNGLSAIQKHLEVGPSQASL
eukprot:scaffold762_cov363-Pavlova_lutheri.AAC.72